jgi:type I site-specific restriction-modification system R (restriction) subunit
MWLKAYLPMDKPMKGHGLMQAIARVNRVFRDKPAYGYPPDLQDAAVQNVLQQAEALSAEWAA